MARSLNKVLLIGNLTRDPELRYTPQGTAVCTFSVATNRQWKTESGEMKDEAEFHRCVAWNQLAEICAKMLKKGGRVYVEGRLQTRKWTGQDGAERTTVEVVVSDMLVLESRRDQVEGGEVNVPEDFGETPAHSEEKEETKEKKVKKGETHAKEESADEDIPF